MLDFDMLNLPDLVPLEAPEITVAPEMSESEEHVEDELVEEPDVMLLDLFNPTEIKQGPLDWVFKGENDLGFTRLATLLTRCIYLTLPNSIIFASEGISVGAKKDLLDRLNELIGETKDKERQSSLKEIKTLIQRINPAPWKQNPEEKQPRIRFTHRHHWHVNYNPDLLGDESNGLHPSGNPQLASRIDLALQVLNPANDLWCELVKDEFSESSLSP